MVPRRLRSLFCLLAVVPGLAMAQEQGPPARKKGALFKSEIDELIGAMTRAARQQKLPALGGDSVEATAKALASVARCHRRYYYPGDVPIVTRSVEHLIRARRPDGGFGDAAATAWTIDALRHLPLEASTFAAEIDAAEKHLATQAAGTAVPSFQVRVSAVLADVRADVFPQQLGSKAQQQAKAWSTGQGELPFGEAAETLLQLVACQVANLALDEAASPGDSATWSPAQQKAYAWLMQQQKDGVFELKIGEQSFPDVAMTGFGVWALQTKPKAQRSADEQRVVDLGARWLLQGQNEDGTFGERQANYTTCVVIGALVRWGDPSVQPALQKAQRALLAFQNAEANDYQPRDRDYGSIGYGSSQRGDLSNLQFALEALRATGLPQDHEALQKALVFLQRTQNLKSVNDFQGKVPHPDQRDTMLEARPGDDGGAAYYPGTSNAGYLVQPDGTAVPRSYGSMTYALLKAYTLCGVPAGDPRVVAAVDWIRKNWTLAVNPGADPAMGEKVKFQGLFYYYMVLAQALDLAQVTTIDVPSGEGATARVDRVDWRQALRTHLEGLQRPDGTWVNAKNDRWMENLPFLCTCYAMAALERCR